MPHRFALAFICLILCSFSSANAEDPVENARKVISGQIDAITASDARTAYSFASPGIRSLFPDESRFLDMVRKRYEPLSRAARYAFGRSKLVGGGELVFQEVIISGRDTKDTTAIYEMRLQNDGSYKVNGVRMLEKTASTGI
ncbi:DUF4864 domain-containing protein [Rhizobium sp. FY34]|uniref:DUF4864 domain-containing protein n=1 Tax=Rhizobium sp. FY34 TaxID=2562309 RepID=UPI0010BFE10D|nr:DUF4864 domain-containing protein [Rhizobium sp. FY34]